MPASQHSCHFSLRQEGAAQRGFAQAVLAAPPAPLSSPGVSPEVERELGFERQEEHYIEEYKAQAVLYRHAKTGAQVMSVQAADENKVFGVVFRTPPKDSTGIPHILEHSVLCGSRKYPVKEPFVELIKGSLHTFLNAFTYPDRTCYPVASTNLQDFYNLVDVYMDAVFFPNCVRDEQVFQQEGWHYELNDVSDNITFKGVVFNEMKGVYSQPDSMLMRLSQQALFPDMTYGVDSGGDPRVIPDLTFEQFQEFHAKFYHPSNARLWFYGDDPAEQRLRIAAEYLDKFEANDAAKESAVPVQPLFSAPRKVVASYAAGEQAAGDAKRHMVAVNWVLADEPLKLEDELALEFLDHLLLGTPGAPLRRALLESGLGEALVGGGLSDELRQPQFAIGLKGVAAGDTAAVEELVLKTLEQLAEEGFDQDAVEASINSIEFALKENNTGSFPRGLSLMLRSMGKWLYEQDPFAPLRFAGPLEDLKARLARDGIKGVFSPLIRKLLLDNSHRVTIELQPDVEKAKQEEEEEEKRLAAVKAAMTAEDLEQLTRLTRDLKEKQETPDPPEALKAVPMLALSDIPKTPNKIPIAVGESRGVTVLNHDLVTNDILYTEVAFDMSQMRPDLLPLVPLFCQSLQEMGTKDLSFVELNHLIGRKTGGISVYPMTTSKRGQKEAVSYLVASGKATSAQVPDLLDLMRVLLQDVQLTDQQRFKTFVAQSRQRMEARIIGGGHGFAAARLDAMDNAAGWAQEQMGGLSYLEYLRALEKRVDEDWTRVSEQLNAIRSSLLARKGAIVNLTAEEATLHAADAPIAGLLDALPETGNDLAASPWDSVLPAANEALIIPTQVNYVGKAGNLYKAGYKLHGSAHVISKHIGMTWLWDRVRVSGGAYGGFCDFDTHSGMFTFLSYRDPNLLKTVDNYDATASFLRSLKLDSEALTKAIIGTMSDVDAYQLPDAKGHTSMVRYMLGITDEERQQRREEILGTQERDFHEFAEVVDNVRAKGAIVAVASAGDVEAANKERPGLLQVKNVL